MNRIDQTINKYLQGESSREEERLIAEYLQGNDVDAQHKDLVTLFAFFRSEKELVSDTDLKTTLDSMVSEKETDTTAKVFSMSRTIRSLAAVMVLAIGAYFAFQYIEGAVPNNNNAFAAVEIEDPEEALEVTLEALSFLSNKLDKNTKLIREEIGHADSRKLLN